MTSVFDIEVPPPGRGCLIASATHNPGFLTRREVIGRYAERCGLDVSDVNWYFTSALWKLACIIAGVASRHQGGMRASPRRLFSRPSEDRDPRQSV